MIQMLGDDLDMISVTFAQALAKRNRANAVPKFGDSRLVFYVVADGTDVETGRCMIERRQGVEVVSRKAVETILGIK